MLAAQHNALQISYSQSWSFPHYPTFHWSPPASSGRTEFRPVPPVSCICWLGSMPASGQ